MAKGIQVVCYATGLVGIVVFVLSLHFYFDSQVSAAGPIDKDKLDAVKGVFDSAVTQTLLPLFNTLITAVLGLVFGKPVVEALATRLRK